MDADPVMIARLTPYLPQEIIKEIMARLPVESLLRFKCVSKQWCLLISSNSYIKTHLAKSSKNKSLEHHRVILGNFIVQANQCFSPSFLQDPLATAVDFGYYPTCGSRDSAYIVGSCNGLVCIIKNNIDFILWNPPIKKFKKLPCFDGDTKGKYISAYGFGFDESNDDYKVFCNWAKLTRDEEGKGLAIIYSLKMDSWREVEDPNLEQLRCYGYGAAVSGKLHWRVHNWDMAGEQQSTVSAFDLEKETFGTVEWPVDNKSSGFLADVIDGCLWCICPSRSYDQADYWILRKEEYGVKDYSWYKLETLDRFSYNYGDDNPCAYYHPVIAGANGEILFWNEDSKFILLKEDGRLLLSSGVVGSSNHALDLPRYPPVIYV